MGVLSLGHHRTPLDTLEELGTRLGVAGGISVSCGAKGGKWTGGRVLSDSHAGKSLVWSAGGLGWWLPQEAFPAGAALYGEDISHCSSMVGLDERMMSSGFSVYGSEVERGRK